MEHGALSSQQQTACSMQLRFCEEDICFLPACPEFVAGLPVAICLLLSEPSSSSRLAWCLTSGAAPEISSGFAHFATSGIVAILLEDLRA
jgi:hypothetical protein